MKILAGIVFAVTLSALTGCGGQRGVAGIGGHKIPTALDCQKMGEVDARDLLGVVTNQSNLNEPAGSCSFTNAGGGGITITVNKQVPADPSAYFKANPDRYGQYQYYPEEKVFDWTPETLESYRHNADGYVGPIGRKMHSELAHWKPGANYDDHPTALSRVVNPKGWTYTLVDIGTEIVPDGGDAAKYVFWDTNFTFYLVQDSGATFGCKIEGIHRDTGDDASRMKAATTYCDEALKKAMA